MKGWVEGDREGWMDEGKGRGDWMMEGWMGGNDGREEE